jgi:hypothetical protein
MKFVTFDVSAGGGRRLVLEYHIEGVHALDRTAVVNRIEDYLLAEAVRDPRVYGYFDTTRAQSTLLLLDGPGAHKSTRAIIKEVRTDFGHRIGKPASSSTTAAGGVSACS